MFTHVRVGCNDIDQAQAFYDAVLGTLGIGGSRMPAMLAYRHDGMTFTVGPPRDGGPATFANGGTIGFAAASRDAVDAFHAAGLAKGGTDEGAPGERNFGSPIYAAYLRDPDGNKIVSFVRG